MTWRLKRTVQCRKCPWIADVDPHTIPDGYSVAKHRALAGTIAKPVDLTTLSDPLRVMACHELGDAHCVGWLANQLGPGNNIALRLRMMSCENGRGLRLRGEQHATFEETLPKSA